MPFKPLKYNVYDKQLGEFAYENITTKEIAELFNISINEVHHCVSNGHLAKRRYLISRVNAIPRYNVYEIAEENLKMSELVDLYGINHKTVKSNADKKPIAASGIYIERVK